MEQTLEDIEYVFVNDCTPDDSIEILANIIKDYPQRLPYVKIIHHEINRGLTSARNSGLFEASGDYVTHCDSDDWVDPTMYEELYLKAIEDDADVVYSDIRMIFKSENLVYAAASFATEKTILMKNYISSAWTCLVNMIVKRDVYIKNNLSSPTHLCYCEDFWLSVRLLHYANKISYLHKAFYNYNRTNETSIVHKLNKKTEKDEQTAYLETIDFFTEQGCVHDYEKELSWRVLKSKQELILDVDCHEEFLCLYPNSHKYIWTCPYINWKLKVFMWMLKNNMKVSINFILKMRNKLGR
jgi:glycosyltransferase involved in cell wall biosynthesis